MSIEIDWAKLTTGDDGLALAESIRQFIHEKFQQVTLPGFIRAVEVHSFEFGEQCPTVVLKDVCDPLPDFYENDDEEEEDEEDGDEEDGRTPSDAADAPASRTTPYAQLATSTGIPDPRAPLKERREATRRPSPSTPREAPPSLRPFPLVEPRLPPLPSSAGLAGHIASPLLSRSSTPGIPGGTSNLSYFHLPLSARLSGTQTPLTAIARGPARHDHHAYPWEHYPRQTSARRLQGLDQDFSYGDPSTRPSTAHSFGQSQDGVARAAPFGEASGSLDGGSDSERACPEPDPNDLQIVLHISYSGDIKMSLTAEILLDYPMPSFVGIPLKLNITGLSFDGVALIAYLKKRAHFCFLGQDDAEMLVGAENALDGEERRDEGQDGGLGGLLKEIRVESEIGQKEGGKQVLKNVGKVEKFVLEQVRRIFEEEMVWPSFWTFLV
ncbi:MAG: Mitochondrial distribution and morphology protein 12 [Stictis urceolatum]|nr:Mitochondrial distribution and morphology protein 12 [Stictis urceolata]